MEFKGTKGTWVVDNEESGYNEYHQLCTPISRIDKLYSTIIWLCDVYGNDEEAKANALLISKAPEMLEMLQMHIYILDNGNLAFYEKYGFNVSELSCKCRELIKEATEL